jgi:hypothetical protein
VIAVSDGERGASRFEAGSDLILLADGIAPDMGDLDASSRKAERDTDGAGRRCPFGIRADRRNAPLGRPGAGRFQHDWGHAAMLGDWDLQSTLLRRGIQSRLAAPQVVGREGGGLSSHRTKRRWRL